MSPEMNASESLADAIRRGDADALRAALAAEPAAAGWRDAGPSAVLQAVYHGRRELLPLLLPHVALDVHEAAALGEVERLRQLLAGDPSLVRRVTPDGWTALHLAAFFADAATVALLLAHGGDVAAVSANATANTPLHAAIAGRTDPEVVRVLVDGGADVEARGGGGWTPLHLAASRGDVALVEYLLARGARADAAADDRRTAAEIAEERGHAAAAARLRTARTGEREE